MLKSVCQESLRFWGVGFKDHRVCAFGVMVSNVQVCMGLREGAQLCTESPYDEPAGCLTQNLVRFTIFIQNCIVWKLVGRCLW